MLTSFVIPFSGTESKLNVNYDQPVHLNPNNEYKVGIVGGYLPVSWPNITASNNTIKLTADGGVTWDTIDLPIGQFSVDDIGLYINSQEKSIKRGDGTYPYIISTNNTEDVSDDTTAINLSYDYASMKSTIYLYEKTGSTFEVDLCEMGAMLGWTDNQKITTAGIINLSTNIPSVEGSYKYYNITCDLVIPTPQPNGAGSQRIIYSNTPAVGPGSIQPLPQISSILWYPLDNSKTTIKEVECRITDQDGKLLDFRGQNVYLSIMITPV